MTCWLCGFETTELTTNAKTPICKNGPCHVCLAITKVDEEINQAVATLQHLVAKRRNLRSEQNCAHDPIHRLPLEIINYTFELVLPLRNEWGAIDRRDRAIMPPYVTSICRSWRDIAWSNPPFWSTIPIVLGRHPTSDQIRFLQTWILRSRMSPLTLNVSVCKANRTEEELKIVLDTISQSSTRWHSLALRLPPELLQAFQHSNFQLQHLKRLGINTGRELRTLDLPLPFLSLEVRPEQIEIIGVSFHSLSISWDHLTSATVRFWTLGDVAQLLQHASQMTYCCIKVVSFNPQSPMPHIIHQKLQTLGLFTGEVGTELLGSLTLPSLQEFHSLNIRPLRSLPALVQRSSCSLTRLTLFGSYGADALYGLQPMSGVTDLCLESTEGEDGPPAPTTFEYCECLMQNLEEYFPDLRRLSLHRDIFIFLCRKRIIPLLLVHKRPQLDAPEERTFCRILVKNPRRIDDLDRVVWCSRIWEQLRALKLSVSVAWTDDGFEILMLDV